MSAYAQLAWVESEAGIFAPYRALPAFNKRVGSPGWRAGQLVLPEFIKLKPTHTMGPLGSMPPACYRRQGDWMDLKDALAFHRPNKPLEIEGRGDLEVTFAEAHPNLPAVGNYGSSGLLEVQRSPRAGLVLDVLNRADCGSPQSDAAYTVRWMVPAADSSAFDCIVQTHDVDGNPVAMVPMDYIPCVTVWNPDEPADMSGLRALDGSEFVAVVAVAVGRDETANVAAERRVNKMHLASADALFPFFGDGLCIAGAQEVAVPTDLYYA